MFEIDGNLNYTTFKPIIYYNLCCIKQKSMISCPFNFYIGALKTLNSKNKKRLIN